MTELFYDPSALIFCRDKCVCGGGGGGGGLRWGDPVLSLDPPLHSTTHDAFNAFQLSTTPFIKTYITRGKTHMALENASGGLFPLVTCVVQVQKQLLYHLIYGKITPATSRPH